MANIQLYLACSLASTSVLFSVPGQAQILPDNTLGTERSSVVTGANVKGDLADLIEGGVIRGPNLFHSFSDFNVSATQRVYFANPENIQSILSRVTGDQTSDIFGTLGVDGGADLFLINPNGIIFGPDVSLDIPGAFFATTAEAVALGSGLFSAVDPGQSSLLSINPNVSFWNYLTERSGNVTNRGQLAVGGDLVLAANNLDLESQVAAGGNVFLLATDTVKVRDTAQTPFVGFAGDGLLVQGNNQVDIVALNHPNSGLFSYGDMTLRSAGQVGGDTHYFSGGSFRVEDLDNRPSTLGSPIDPIIRALGDVTIGNYQGASLHILAAGNVTLGTAEIISPEETNPGVDFLQETVSLSDGTVVDIDGSAQPTLDVRAGISPATIGVPPLPLITGLNATDSFSPGVITSVTPTGGDITIGDVALRSPNGLILLTNQYQPDAALPPGDILITGEGNFGFGIDARNSFGQGGTVFIDSRNNVEVINSGIETTSTGDVGDIVLLADNGVKFEGFNPTLNQQSLARTSLQPFAIGTGGDIKITAGTLDILEGTQLIASSAGVGNAGSVVLTIRDTARFEGSAPSGLPSVAISAIEPFGQGTGGNVEITADNLELLNGAQIATQLDGQGASGDVVLNIRDTVRLAGTNSITGDSSFVLSPITFNAQGTGGNIKLTATNLDLQDGALIDASTLGNGDAGDVTVTIQDTVRLEGVNPSDGIATQISSDVISNFQRAGGNVQVTAANLEVLNGARIDTEVFETSSGTAGNVTLNISGNAKFEGFDPTFPSSASRAGSFLARNSQGQGGDVDITTTNLKVLNGAQLGTATFGEGNAGSVTLNIAETVLIDEDNSPRETIVSSSIEEGGQGTAGNIEITTTNLQVLNGGSIQSATSGQGDAGNIEVTADALDVLNGGQLAASTFGEGDAGDVILTIAETARFDGASPTLEFSRATSEAGFNAQGNAGNVAITATNLEVLNGGFLSTLSGSDDGGNIVLAIRDTARFAGVGPNGSPSAAGSSLVPGSQGNSGDIEIIAGNLEVLDRALIFSSTISDGDAGNLEITANNLDLIDGGRLSSASLGNGNAGDIVITIADTARIEGASPENTIVSSIASNIASDGQGTGGDLILNATALLLKGGAFLSASSRGQGNAGDIALDIQNRFDAVDGSVITESDFNAGGQIEISAGSIFLSGDSDITTFVNSGIGSGGKITIITDSLTALDDSDILAFSLDGQGGDVDLSQTAFFGQRFEPAPRGTDPRTLDNNNRVDINAAGRVASGNIDLLDTNFIVNSLTELPDNFVNTEALVATSCIRHRANAAGEFTISSNGYFSHLDSLQVNYSSGTVQPVTMAESLQVSALLSEPEEIYQLADDRLVMSRDCTFDQ